MANGDLGGTTGTKFDPLLVEDALDLIALQDLGSIFPDRNPYEEPFFVLQVADIDMSGHGWSSPMFGFMYYNGKMRKISNLTLETSDFFGYNTYDVCGIAFENLLTKDRHVLITDGHVYGITSSFKNLQISGISETGNPLLGNTFSDSVFDNVHIDMICENNNRFNGGFTNQLDDCYVKNCSTQATLSDSSSVPNCGGFAMTVYGGLIENCESKVVGDIQGSGFISYLGKSWGEHPTPKIYDCSSTATIVGHSYGHTAGFVGIQTDKVEIKNCYCSGTIANGVQMTGFAGLTVGVDVEDYCTNNFSDIIIENCYSLIESITRDSFQGPNQIYRFSPCSRINNANYVNSSMQFIDHFEPPEGMPPELWEVPFDDGIEVSGVTMPEHEYPVGFCPDPVPVHQCKTFYLN